MKARRGVLSKRRKKKEKSLLSSLISGRTLACSELIFIILYLITPYKQKTYDKYREKPLEGTDSPVLLKPAGGGKTDKG